MAYLTYTAPPIWLERHRLDPRLTVGAYTYFHQDITFGLFRADDVITIGRFCSIARSTIIFGGGNHYAQRATTYPFHVFGAHGDADWQIAQDADVEPAPATHIGNDVWIGEGCRVMPGARVGHGAILASGAVVARNIRPYAIVGGNPAREIRRRFSDSDVERLLALAWWDWPIEKVLANLDLLMQSPVAWGDNIRVLEASASRVDFPRTPTRAVRVWRRLVRMSEAVRTKVSPSR